MRRNMRTGLVLEGGAMRGLFTAGVLDVMMENGIEFDGAVGVSAGATFGCNYKSRQIGRTIRYNRRFAKDPRYGSFKSLLLKGDYYGAKFCYSTLPRKLDPFDFKTFKENPMEFYVVCTDVHTGKAVYQKLYDGRKKDMAWIRASASMPLFSTPVEIDGGVYLDGGLSDSIPLEFLEKTVYERNVVVLTQPFGFVKKGSLIENIVPLFLGKYPELIKAMKKRPSEYNRELGYIRHQEIEGKALVIRPPKALDIGRTEHDPGRMQAVYEIGRSEGEKRLEEVKEFVKASAESEQLK